MKKINPCVVGIILATGVYMILGNLITLSDKFLVLYYLNYVRIYGEHRQEIQKQEYPSLDNFLYEAIFIPEGIKLPPTPIITSPELQIYVQRFGETKDDLELVAEIVGAVWVRIMNNYEHIDYETLLIINRCITMTMMTGLLRVIALMKKGMKKIIVTNGKKLNISHLIN